MFQKIKTSIDESICLKRHLVEDASFYDFIDCIRKLLSAALINNHKVVVCGNGGSAADSQHFAAELVGRFMRERKALPVVALTTDTSVLTAIGNDYGFDRIFERQVEALCTEGDVLLVISTSGNSKNQVNAILKAKELGATTVALLGKTGGECLKLTDYSYVVPSVESARIQEVHLFIEHLICELVEEDYVSKK